MIYTQQNNAVEILLIRGKHRTRKSKVELTLVLVKFIRDKHCRNRHYFAEYLKADGGPAEIQTAMQLCQESPITGERLELALAEAQ